MRLLLSLMQTILDLGISFLCHSNWPFAPPLMNNRIGTRLKIQQYALPTKIITHHGLIFIDKIYTQGQSFE